MVAQVRPKTYDKRVGPITAVGSASTVDGINPALLHHTMGIRWYNDSAGGPLVTPTAGQVDIDVLNDITGVLDEAKGEPLPAVDPSRTALYACSITEVTATPENVTGATHYQLVVVSRSESVFGADGGSLDSPLITRSGSILALDAWQRPKAVIDKSLIHGMFTNSIIPASTFKETFNGVEQSTFTNAISDSGLLVLSAGATLNDETVLDTYRSPRYEPNRGHLYSSSIIVPNPTALGERDFGMFTEENGAFFRVKSDGNLYACQRTTDNGGPTTSTLEELIDTDRLPAGFNLAKGNIYDIQMQWRGVGNVKYFVGDPTKGESVLVHTMNNLNNLDGLSIANPALPIAYRCENLGDNVQIKSGCSDITSEGGTDESHEYDSLGLDDDDGQVAISGLNVPILAVRNKLTVGGLRNMRDIQALTLYAYADQRAVVRVWATRDWTAITENDQTWQTKDSFLEYITYDIPNVATPMTFDTAKASLVFTARVDQDQTFFSPAQFDGKTEIHQSPGDMFIFTMHRETGGAANVGVTYEFGKET